jgi:hypothetical protein
MTWLWQYNGRAGFSNIIAWCQANLQDDTWSYPGWETIEFYDQSAYVLFLLRWS